ncbi:MULTISPECIES: 8-oxo-dGTP diphosphatase [Bacillus]|jgi:8-oxo-dGTP diphosphatase|uniref:8-oxo-dGTP diphosphatase n=2 Tax=Bacillus safensis TaxID=561879 RepID=A0A0M2EG78_BACIA|nr:MULTISPECIES: 8-oxo-dGTP diphosphatase [Bacillus]KLK98272.1 NUDIX hydrolase [Bacillus pumilus]MBW4854356.1 8-oxo-dGTP diphosphatase [Bacillaceae bacterium]PNU24972.1 8-oxo-dGTP diphosphatase [Bacillus stratosphericus]APT45204.1 NUDIX hydrolase [Bacillus safensis]APT51014.1 NUDIX hydrolase [Bacillus safensis]
MQRVTNCVLHHEDQVLLLQKPRRGWWVAPGGKMESGESVKDSVVREYREETGIYILNPQLKGVFTFIIKEGDQIVQEWMMFTFMADSFTGKNVTESEEGILKWHDVKDVPHLPMAPGDSHILDFMLKGKGLLHGTFTYTPDFELIAYRLDPQGE